MADREVGLKTPGKAIREAFSLSYGNYGQTKHRSPFLGLDRDQVIKMHRIRELLSVFWLTM